MARRNRSLIDRQLAMLDEFEAEVDDPEVLSNYYQLDHMATRMRRNSESLLVLANAEPKRRRVKATEIDDVVRAAIGEVEDYRRIEVETLEHLQVRGNVVADVSHLLAELLDNATSFSPPDSVVRVGGRRAGDSYMLRIVDSGVGISSDRLAELNELLREPPIVGLSVEPTLGMSVVSLLASRHGIMVTLSHGSPGTTVDVLLPSIDVRPDRRARTRAGAHHCRAAAGRRADRVGAVRSVRARHGVGRVGDRRRGRSSRRCRTRRSCPPWPLSNCSIRSSSRSCRRCRSDRRRRAAARAPRRARRRPELGGQVVRLHRPARGVVRRRAVRLPDRGAGVVRRRTGGRHHRDQPRRVVRPLATADRPRLGRTAPAGILVAHRRSPTLPTRAPRSPSLPARRPVGAGRTGAPGTPGCRSPLPTAAEFDRVPAPPVTAEGLARGPVTPGDAMPPATVRVPDAAIDPGLPTRTPGRGPDGPDRMAGVDVAIRDRPMPRSPPPRARARCRRR